MVTVDVGGDLRYKGELSIKLIKADGTVIEHAEAPIVKAPPKARTRNGWKVLRRRLAFWMVRRLHVAYFRSELRIRHYDASRGVWVDYGVVGMKSVTDAGVEFLVDDWDTDAQDITTMNFHDSGVGIVGEMVTDVDLGTPAGPTTRATGTKSQPNPEDLQTVATIAYTSSLAITEHGIFNDATRGSDFMWDRTVFGAINVDSGDSIEFTYTCTINSGG